MNVSAMKVETRVLTVIKKKKNITEYNQILQLVQIPKKLRIKLVEPDVATIITDGFFLLNKF